MTEREGRPGENTGAALEPVSNELPNDTPGGYRLSLVDDAAGSKTPTDDFAAELEELLAAAKAKDNDFEPPKYEDNDFDRRGDNSVQDALRDGPPGDVGPQRLEDAHIGERIAKDHLQEFVHAKGFGWLKFDGRRWKPVEQTIVDEVVRQALIDFHRSEAQSAAEPSRLQQISRMLSAPRIRAIAYITKLCRTTEETFDAHPDLLNVHNGVVNLRDGTLRPHDPDLMFTKVTMVDYVPGASHQDWHQALAALPADAEDWLQIRMGQGLTGHPVPDDRMVVLKGSGSNGKTTIVDGVREALGPDYAVALPDRVLLARRPGPSIGCPGRLSALGSRAPRSGVLRWF